AGTAPKQAVGRTQPHARRVDSASGDPPRKARTYRSPGASASGRFTLHGTGDAIGSVPGPLIQNCPARATGGNAGNGSQASIDAHLSSSQHSDQRRRGRAVERRTRVDLSYLLT